jgi:chromosome segregation ATPase
LWENGEEPQDMPLDEKEQELLINLRLDIKGLTTLMETFKEASEKHSRDIGQAWDCIHAMTADVRKNEEDIHKLSMRQDTLEKNLEAQLEKLSDQMERLKDTLNEHLHRMSDTRSQVKILWGLFTAAVLGAAGAFIKLFTK